MYDSLQEATSATGVSLKSIEAAASRIKAQVYETLILTSRLLNEYLNSGHNSSIKFFFKAENLQKTGSFKIRCALNTLATLETSAGTPVVTHSSGNHAAALAAAASVHSRRAHIVIPCTTPESKIAAMRSYGGLITRRGPTYKDRTMIHPFLNPCVVSGEGMIGLEITRQVPNVDAIIVPIGGGGLIGGISIAVKSLRPGVAIIGAEPQLASAGGLSMEERHGVLDDGSAKTVADGVESGVGELGREVLRA